MLQEQPGITSGMGEYTVEYNSMEYYNESISNL